MNNNGRGWAYTGLLIGAAASIAGNVADVRFTPSAIPLELRYSFAALAPLILFVAIEIAVRTVWRHGWHVVLIRVAGMTTIILVSGYVSWKHISHLAAMSGAGIEVAWAWPLMIDGLLAMSTIALLMSKPVPQDNRPPRRTLASRVADVRTMVLDVNAAALGHAQSVQSSEPVQDAAPAAPEPVQDKPAPAAAPRQRTTFTESQRKVAETMISDTLLDDRTIAAEVFAVAKSDVTDAQRKRIGRLRSDLRRRAGLGAE